jgi:two-component system, chemotaxis family, chemotaxis protein CheY
MIALAWLGPIRTIAEAHNSGRPEIGELSKFVPTHNGGAMGKVILTVDDSASIRQMVKFTLSEAGYTVIEAVDGQDALAKLNGPVNLVITDLNMPNLDGIGLIRKVRANPACKGLPIIMLTTESQESRKQEGKAAGATGWIVKPFTKEQMLAVVKRIIG